MSLTLKQAGVGDFHLLVVPARVVEGFHNALKALFDAELGYPPIVVDG